MRTPKVTELPGLAFPASARERRHVIWRLSPRERMALMRAGELTLEECCQWAARAPHEVPVVNGEFEFIVAFAPETCEEQVLAEPLRAAGYARERGTPGPTRSRHPNRRSCRLIGDPVCVRRCLPADSLDGAG